MSSNDKHMVETGSEESQDTRYRFKLKVKVNDTSSIVIESKHVVLCTGISLKYDQHIAKFFGLPRSLTQSILPVKGQLWSTSIDAKASKIIFPVMSSQYWSEDDAHSDMNDGSLEAIESVKKAKLTHDGQGNRYTTHYYGKVLAQGRQGTSSHDGDNGKKVVMLGGLRRPVRWQNNVNNTAFEDTEYELIMKRIHALYGRMGKPTPPISPSPSPSLYLLMIEMALQNTNRSLVMLFYCHDRYQWE